MIVGTQTKTSGRPITRHSAQALAALIRERKVSARDVVEAHIAAIDSVNPRLNAVVARPGTA